MQRLSEHHSFAQRVLRRTLSLAGLRGLSFLLALMILLAAASPLQGAGVVIVRASDAEPYVQAEVAIRARLVAHKDDVRTVVLKDILDKEVAATLGQPDLVVAVGTPAARWLQKQLPPKVKLVYCMVTNAEDAGLLAGRDAWGVTTEIAISDQIKVVDEALPHARVVGMLYRSDTLDGKRGIDSVRKALPEGWRLEALAANEYPSIAAAIDALTQKNIDLIWTSADQKVYDTAAVRALLLAALRTKTPVLGFSPAFVRAGALIGTGVDPRSQGNQAADLAIRAAAGSCTAANKAEAPAEFQIAVNLIVAKQIGVEIPESLSRKATYVYRSEN